MCVAFRSAAAERAMEGVSEPINCTTVRFVCSFPSRASLPRGCTVRAGCFERSAGEGCRKYPAKPYLGGRCIASLPCRVRQQEGDDGAIEQIRSVGVGRGEGAGLAGLDVRFFETEAIRNVRLGG